MKDQNERLLQALKRRPLTTRQIEHQLAIGRPAARVHELRGMGHCIEAEIVEVRNRFGQRCRVARYAYVGRKSSAGRVAA